MSFASVLFQVCLDRLQQVELTARLIAVLRRVPHLLAATASSPTWEYHIFFFQTISETHNKTYETYMRRGWISRQLGGRGLNGGVRGRGFFFFFPPVRFSTERFVCVLASEGASSAVWSCSTEMSADLCYSRGIGESVRHQKTLLLDSFPPEHPSSFHSGSYRTLDPVRGFPSCTSERVTKKKSSCDAGFCTRLLFFFPSCVHRRTCMQRFLGPLVPTW